MALFEAIARALGRLPIVAEDLGLITPDVDALRRRFALPGMCVLQFAFGDDSRNRHLPHHHEPDSRHPRQRHGARAASASVADTAILTMQDVLGLGSESRMNTPARGEGCWEWRFEWSQLEPRHAERLEAMARLYGGS